MSDPSQVWFLEPRDPLALGDGRSPVGMFRPEEPRLPLPQTVAGMVRAQFVRAHSTVTAQQARELVAQIQIEGPLLVRQVEKGRFTPWVTAPADARVDEDGSPLHPKVQPMGPGQGTVWPLWPQGLPPPSHLVHLPARTPDGQKTKPPLPFWPLDAAVTWALGGSGDRQQTKPLYSETRVHVVIDDESGSADPGLLFTSGGMRFADGFGLLVQITAPAAAAWPPSLGDVVVLGGESRPTFRRLVDENAWPDFATYSKRYGGRLGQEALDADPVSGLRLQLLTHAYLRGVGGASFLPSWLREDGRGCYPGLDGLELRLAALCLPRHVAASGWDLQANGGQGGPRSVRRLVPAGTVYYFALVDQADTKRLQEACKHLFGHALDPGGVPDVDGFRAAPHEDGMGLVLPGVWSETITEKRSA